MAGHAAELAERHGGQVRRFTDSLFEIFWHYEGKSEAPQAAYRLNGETGELRIVADDVAGLNGLGFSPTIHCTRMRRSASPTCKPIIRSMHRRRKQPSKPAKATATTPGACRCAHSSRHQVTGRKSLFIGRHAFRIPDMAKALLLEHACRVPRTYSHAWEPGDLMIWDNRCVLTAPCLTNMVSPRHAPCSGGGDGALRRLLRQYWLETARDIEYGLPPSEQGAGCAKWRRSQPNFGL